MGNRHSLESKERVGAGERGLRKGGIRSTAGFETYLETTAEEFEKV